MSGVIFHERTVLADFCRHRAKSAAAAPAGNAPLTSKVAASLQAVAGSGGASPIIAVPGSPLMVSVRMLRRSHESASLQELARVHWSCCDSPGIPGPGPAAYRAGTCHRKATGTAGIPPRRPPARTRCARTSCRRGCLGHPHCASTTYRPRRCSPPDDDRQAASGFGDTAAPHVSTAAGTWVTRLYRDELRRTVASWTSESAALGRSLCPAYFRSRSSASSRRCSMTLFR